MIGNEINWDEFYKREHQIKRFIPWESTFERSRVSFALSLVPSKDRIKSVLDIGCAEGYLCNILKNLGIDSCFGLDISSARIQYARDKFPKCFFSVGKAENLSFKANSFELVTCIQVLEHLKNPEKVFSELARVSQKYILITVPYAEKPEIIMCPQCGTKFPHWGHIQSFGEERLEQLCKNASLRIIKVRYFIDVTFLNENPIFRYLPANTKEFIRILLFRLKLVSPINFGILCKKEL